MGKVCKEKSSTLQQQADLQPRKNIEFRAVADNYFKFHEVCTIIRQISEKSGRLNVDVVP